MPRGPLVFLTSFFTGLGVPKAFAQPAAIGALVLATLLLAWAVDFATNRTLVAWFKRFAASTHNAWDKAMVEARVPERLAHVAPALMVHGAVPFVLPQHDSAAVIIQRVAMAFVAITVAYAIGGALDAAVGVYRDKDRLGRAPVKTYVQVGKIILALLVVVLVVSRLLGESPWAFLSGLGALTAVIMLVFKDSILGFVASVQLATNDMVRRGDWIEMPKYGANGDVLDVSLNTVKVQNFDKTISTIPTYQLMQDSFINWRGMNDSGGRRIKRCLYIDVTSIRFCDEAMLQGFARVDLLKSYLRDKRQEVEESNRTRAADDLPTNFRRLTNVGTFRAYVVAYLREHPKIHNEMTFLVRHLEPGDRGLPIEVYVFSNDQDWGHYEAIQADLFDHFFAVLPEFGLRAFQLPSGADLWQGPVGNLGALPTT
ncbi:MAG: mechanosensitive ion channel domain-containing protein [Polyangiales bacterium]